MNKAISPGELAVKQHITVLKWEPVVHEADGFLTTKTVVYEDNSYKGDVLRVEAVQLPFVVVRRVNDYLDSSITLDTRRVSLMELSPEYVKAAHPKYVAP